MLVELGTDLYLWNHKAGTYGSDNLFLTMVAADPYNPETMQLGNQYKLGSRSTVVASVGIGLGTVTLGMEAVTVVKTPVVTEEYFRQ